MVLRSNTSQQPQENPFQHSRSYRLRSRRKRSSEEQQPRIDSFEEATRLLRMFHAHEARSLDSILEHPEDDSDINYDAPIFFSLSRQLTKAKTMACLSDLDESSRKGDLAISGNGTISDPSQMGEHPSIPASTYSKRLHEDDDDWEF